MDSKPYKGDLSKPIPYRKLLAAALRTRKTENSELAADTLAAYRAQRFHLLFKHYGIQPDVPDAWATLAFELALNHVPGFSIGKDGKRERGRPRAKLPKELVSPREPRARSKTGPKSRFSDEDVDAMVEYMPIFQKQLKEGERPATKTAVINFYLDLVVEKTKKRIPNRKAVVKTLLNRVRARSRVTSRK